MAIPAKRLVVALSVAAAAAAALWWRRNPSPCPAGFGWTLRLPRPVISVARLCEILEVGSGQRILEVGPGTGYYALPVARQLGPGGTLAVMDIQREMLDYVTEGAGREGLENIEATHGNAEKLPYPDNSFDSAYLVTVLGEVPNQDAALGELARVVRSGGAAVFGEIAFDPHMVTLNDLRSRAEAVGFRYERKYGNALAYFARFSSS